MDGEADHVYMMVLDFETTHYMRTKIGSDSEGEAYCLKHIQVKNDADFIDDLLGRPKVQL